MRFTIGRSTHKVIVITTIIFLVAGCDNGLTGTSEDIQGFWKVTALADRPPVPEYVTIKDDQEAYHYYHQGNNLENSRNCYLRTDRFFWDVEGEEDVYIGLNIEFRAEFDGPNIIGRNIDPYSPDYGDFLLEPVEGLSAQDINICN